MVVIVRAIVVDEKWVVRLVPTAAETRTARIWGLEILAHLGL